MLHEEIGRQHAEKPPCAGIDVLDFTGERVVPWHPKMHEWGWVIQHHALRYSWALDKVCGRSVVDLGCGCGYGSFMLSWIARTVRGLDCDSTTLEFARDRFRAHNLSFGLIDLESPSFVVPEADVYVAFEVLEHLEDPLETVARLPRHGTLLFSFPVDMPNPYHKWRLSTHDIEARFAGASFWYQAEAGGQIVPKNQAVLPPTYVIGIMPLSRDNAPVQISLSHESGSPSADLQPRVTIVMPVWNKAAYTTRCISALIANTPDSLYDLVVVDNASTDETPELLAGLSGDVSVIRNDANLGFTVACNQGADLAKGDYILFLNNDTEPLPGWLDSLIALADSDPKIGAVGAKLVYPNGSLQEAGAVIFADGTGWNYGRGGDPFDPRYNFVRDVDYCSGAALLVRRSAWCAVGGFDVRYAPAYYEDADLCFSLRTAGYRVMYQPESVVIHHEGATSGVDLGQGMKRFQAENRAKFVAKWSAVLASEHVPSAAQLQRASSRVRGKRILVVDPIMPVHDRAAGSKRLFEMLRMMRGHGHHITFIARNGLGQERYVGELQQMGVEVYPFDDIRLRDLGYTSPNSALDLEQLLRRGEYDIAILSHFDVAEQYLPLIRRYSPSTRVVVDTVDVHYLREQRAADLHRDVRLGARARATKCRELAIYREADELIAVTESDRQELLSNIPDAVIHIMPTVHDVELPESSRAFGERNGLLFVGNFGHPPNVDSVIYFCREVLPLIRSDLPDITLTVVGDAPPTELTEFVVDGSVVLTGYVPDMRPYLSRCRISVAPLRYGAGIKGKIGEALAAGLPVVTTSIGVEGMSLPADHEVCLVADEPEHFATDVIRLYRDHGLWARLSAAGRHHVDVNFSVRAVATKLESIINNGPYKAPVPVTATKPSDVREQDWRRQPSGRELTSIVVLVHNQWECTEQCLRSIIRWTREPYEIIVVDNGSSRSTARKLRSFAAGRSQIRVITNAENRGFAAGNNQGIAMANGEFVVLLNNDTIVPDGWLSRMQRVMYEYPFVGVVGPMSNSVSGPQLVSTASYHTVAEMLSFSARWGKERDGKSLPVPRLAGFCMLIRRGVIDAIGGLDERFGVGNYEDDDFCIRAFLSGFQVRIAQDAFVHHIGSQTFRDERIDFAALMHRNWDIFKRKWRMAPDTPISAGWNVPPGFPDDLDPYCPVTSRSSECNEKALSVG